MKPFYYTFVTICISISTVLAHAADTAIQTLKVTIPLVALIDVEDISPAFTFTPPTDAGQGFVDPATPSNNEPLVAISSNNSAARLEVKTNIDLSANNLQLEISNLSGFPGGFNTPAISNSGATFATVGTMQSTTGKIRLTARGTSTGVMIPHGNYPIEVTYTLTQN